MEITLPAEVCISCGKELAVMERNRTECWECREKANESYSDDEEEEFVNEIGASSN